MGKLTRTFKKDGIKVNVYSEETTMGKAAADFAAEQLQSVLLEKGSANLILATGACQFLFLDELKQKALNWEKITVFHLDEYKGMSDKHPASFRKYLKERILDLVNPGTVHLINADAEDLQKEVKRYEDLLKEHPVDVACIGIGENGHIAFNDPPVADFNDPFLVKVVKLDEDCRRQQLGEGWFPTLEDVPKEAVSLTIPAIMNCRIISCVVPGKRKADAVRKTLNSEISTTIPASILRSHPNVVLFLDSDSASET